MKPDGNEEPGRARQTGPRRWLAPLLVAAAAAALFFLVRVGGNELAAPSTDEGHRLDESGDIQLLEPLAAAQLAAQSTRFRWTPSHDVRAFQYELSLLDARGAGDPTLLFRTRTLETQFEPRLPLPRELLWRVQALDARGVPVGRPSSARVLATP